MNFESTIWRIAACLEHMFYSDLTVAERQIVDVLKENGYAYIAEDGTIRSAEL